MNSNKSNCKENPILEPTQKTEKGEERSKKWLHKKKSAFGGALFLDFLLFPVQFAALPLFLPLFILLSHEEGRSIYLQNKTEKFTSLSSSSSSLSLSLSGEKVLLEKERSVRFSFSFYLWVGSATVISIFNGIRLICWRGGQRKEMSPNVF